MLVGAFLRMRYKNGGCASQTYKKSGLCSKGRYLDGWMAGFWKFHWPQRSGDLCLLPRLWAFWLKKLWYWLWSVIFGFYRTKKPPFGGFFRGGGSVSSVCVSAHLYGAIEVSCPLGSWGWWWYHLAPRPWRIAVQNLPKVFCFCGWTL